MRIVLFSLLIFLWACNSENSKPNSSESQTLKDTAKKSITMGEWVKDTTTWQLLEDSVIIDDVLCDKYRNKITNQIVIVAYDE